MDILQKIELEEQARSLQIQYKLRWPHHCVQCKGVGGFWKRFDPSPAGVSLGYGSITDFEMCFCCLEADICPRCGKNLPGELAGWKVGIMFFVEVPSWDGGTREMVPECPWCGFVSQMHEGMPELPELPEFIEDFSLYMEGLL